METPELPQRFAILTAELTELQAELDEVYAALSAGPDLGLEERAATLRQRRGPLCERWGLIALAWIAQGGEVQLGDPASEVDVVESPTQEDEVDAPTVDIPASERDLARLQAIGLSPGWVSEAPPAPRFDVAELRALCDRIGPPVLLTEAAQAAGEVSRLAAELDNMERWHRFPRAAQHALVGMFAARLRHIQDELPPALRRAVNERRLSASFPHLTRFSEEARPGFVMGLGRGQAPEHGDWAVDAREWWENLEAELPQPEPSESVRSETVGPDRALANLRTLLSGDKVDPQELRIATILALDLGLAAENTGLVRALRDHLEDLEGDARLKGLRRAIRKTIKAEMIEAADAFEADDDVAVIPEDWPYLALTRDRTGVIVGGDPRESARATIQQALGFAALSWESGYDVRSAQALAARIERGGVDFVIFLQSYISHKMTDILMPACKSSEALWIMVEHGYGLTRVKIAIERYVTI